MKWRSMKPYLKGGPASSGAPVLPIRWNAIKELIIYKEVGVKRGDSVFFSRSLPPTVPSFPLLFLPLFHLASIDGERVVGVDERRLPPCAHPEATPMAKCVVGHHHLSKSRATALWISHDLKMVPVLHFHTQKKIIHLAREMDTPYLF